MDAGRTTAFSQRCTMFWLREEGFEPLVTLAFMGKEKKLPSKWQPLLCVVVMSILRGTAR